MGGWQPGHTVVLRHHNHPRAADRRSAGPSGIRSGRPVLWIAGGIASKWPGVGNRGVREISPEERFTTAWEPLDSMWWGEGVLIVGPLGRAHAIWLPDWDEVP